MTPTYAHTINPLAGLHVVTSDADEIEASARAAETSLLEYPYYRERFGERARMFGASDGAWLVTLCQGERDYVRKQVTWLGEVLSSRGLPRFLLERHLEFLHRELLRLTSSESRCQPLLEAAHFLRTLRHESLSDYEFKTIAAGFEERADAAWVRRLSGMGSILVAAAADEACGIGRAVTSVAEWAADPALFPESWIAAVGETLAEARSAALQYRGR